MLRVVLSIIVILLLALPVLGWWMIQSSLPKADGIAVVHGLSKEAAIVTDERGVPYITASSQADLYRAQGYWVASQRLFQMDMLRRISRGELAEVFGSQCLSQDKLMRQIGFSRLAKEEEKLLSKETRQALQFYCQGVNAAIEEQEGRKPLEFMLLGYYPRQWQPEDTLAIMKYIQYTQEESWTLDDLRQRVLDKVGPEITSTLFEDGFGKPAAQAADLNGPPPGIESSAKPNPAETGSQPEAAPPGAAAVKGGSVTTGGATGAGSANAATETSPGGKDVQKEKAHHAAETGQRTSSTQSQVKPKVNKPKRPKNPSRPLPKNNSGDDINRTEREINGVEREINGVAPERPQQRIPDSRELPPMVRKYLESLPGIGSNGWVVAGSATDTGGCLLALDRHSELSDPNLWFTCSLSTADFKVCGITIPGVPGIMYGRNNSIAWGATAYKADTQDLFVEKFSPQFPNKYKTPDGWAAAREIIEEIPCKGAFQKQLYQHKVVVTRHGPILLENESNNTAVALAWTGHDIAEPQLETLYRLNRAGNWQQFRNILKAYRGATQTFLYADRNGNIGSQIAGNIPLRKQSELTGRLKASQVLLGWPGRYDWTARLEFQEMPSSYNPKEGFLIANAINLNGFQAPVTPYPVQRAQFVLASYKPANRKPGLPDMADLQADEYAPLQVLVKSTLQKCINKQEVIDQFQLSALKFMDKWDGYLRRPSASAAIYESFIRTVAKRMISNKLGAPLTQEYLRRWPRWSVQVERMLSQKDNEWLPVGERTFETFMVTSFSQSLKDLRSTAGDAGLASLSWEKYHRARFKNLLFDGQPDWESTLGSLFNASPVGVGGDGDTINAFPIDMTNKSGEFISTIAPTERLLIDMSDGDKFYETQPLGQSGQFLAPNRLDQLRAWIQASPLPVAFSDQQAEKQQRHKAILTPEGSM